MARMFRHEFYPDMTDKEYGKKVVTLYCAVSNGKRFKKLTTTEKVHLVEMIERFEKSLTVFKKELITW